MICPICLRSFTPEIKTQRYCKPECSRKAHNNPKRRDEGKAIAIEWLTWNQDFKAGKTVSNL